MSLTHDPETGAAPHASPATTAVIGAGLAGLTVAAALTAQGQAVTVYEKSRGPGGRAATRRTPAGTFDHGAATATPQSTEFAAAWQGWQARGWAAQEFDAALTGTPSMNALMQHLANGLDVRSNVHVSAIEASDAGWSLRTLEGTTLPHRPARVLMAVPAEQAAALLAPDAALAATMQTVRSDPCWTVMAAWPGPLPVAFAQWQGSDPLAPLATARRDDSRPGRPAVPGVASRWVLHATPHWTRHNLDIAPATAANHLLAAWADALGVRLAHPAFSVAHRWLYAQVMDARPEPFGWNAEIGMGACGDAWHATPGAAGLERAWLSARALAAALGATAT